MAMCRDCGYLALRRISDNALVEAHSLVREDGRTRGQGTHSGDIDVYEPHALCFRQQAELHLAPEGHSNIPAHTNLAAITQDHDCPEFREWQQGFTPKEHRELHLAEIADQRDAQRIEDDRKWREEQARDAHDRHLEALRSNRQTALWTAIIAVLSTLLTATLTAWLMVYFVNAVTQQ